MISLRFRNQTHHKRKLCKVAKWKRLCIIHDTSRILHLHNTTRNSSGSKKLRNYVGSGIIDYSRKIQIVVSRSMEK